MTAFPRYNNIIMKIVNENFWYNTEDERTMVFQVFPDVYGDNRGSFSEVLKCQSEWLHDKSEYPIWFSSIHWIRQINRSKSSSGVIRGCHAQKGSFCQGKLVEAINRRIYDVITDARPQSDTFGVTQIFLLDPIKQNKLWVPRGFLHGFVVPYDDSEEQAIFNYYVDNIYYKDSEICVNPKTLIDNAVKKMDMNIGKEDFDGLYEMFSEGFDKEKIYSEKDMKGQDYDTFMNHVKSDYEKSDEIWYE